MTRLFAFLNHLCDEELPRTHMIMTNDFLNHLCDEELACDNVTIFYLFLNHLCDEELDDHQRHPQ